MKAILIFSIFFILGLNNQLRAQQIKRNIILDLYGRQEQEELKKSFGHNKFLIDKYELQTLIALSYFPELKDVKITFRYKKKISPLMTRPTLWSALFKRPEKRQYIVIISNNSNDNLDPVLFDKMPVNAQIGVLGHELSHISYFLNTSAWGMIKIAFGNLSPKYLDKLEYHTDELTIDHGLGYQLLAWSEFVKNTFTEKYWKGQEKIPEEEINYPRIRERYMHSSTINKILEAHPLYQNIQ
ncbi:MAG TPA: hypothetical protein VIK89_03450 [Cytophagaceae bacterium]